MLFPSVAFFRQNIPGQVVLDSLSHFVQKLGYSVSYDGFNGSHLTVASDATENQLAKRSPETFIKALGNLLGCKVILSSRTAKFTLKKIAPIQVSELRKSIQEAIAEDHILPPTADIGSNPQQMATKVLTARRQGYEAQIDPNYAKKVGNEHDILLAEVQCPTRSLFLYLLNSMTDKELETLIRKRALTLSDIPSDEASLHLIPNPVYNSFLNDYNSFVSAYKNMGGTTLDQELSAAHTGQLPIEPLSGSTTYHYFVDFNYSGGQISGGCNLYDGLSIKAGCPSFVSLKQNNSRQQFFKPGSTTPARVFHFPVYFQVDPSLVVGLMPFFNQVAPKTNELKVVGVPGSGLFLQVLSQAAAANGCKHVLGIFDDPSIMGISRACETLAGGIYCSPTKFFQTLHRQSVSIDGDTLTFAEPDPTQGSDESLGISGWRNLTNCTVNFLENGNLAEFLQGASSAITSVRDFRAKEGASNYIGYLSQALNPGLAVQTKYRVFTLQDFGQIGLIPSSQLSRSLRYSMTVKNPIDDTIWNSLSVVLSPFNLTTVNDDQNSLLRLPWYSYRNGAYTPQTFNAQWTDTLSMSIDYPIDKSVVPPRVVKRPLSEEEALSWAQSQSVTVLARFSLAITDRTDEGALFNIGPSEVLLVNTTRPFSSLNSVQQQAIISALEAGKEPSLLVNQW